MMIVNRKETYLLDCTLRDGGYYTNWDYPTWVIEKYAKIVNDLPIDAVEIGLISELEIGGRFHHIDHNIASFFKSRAPSKQIAIMLNANEFVSGENLSEKRLVELLARAFPNNSSSLIDMVRIATNYLQVPQSLNAAKLLKDFFPNISVSLNLMQIAELSSTELMEISTLIGDSKIIDVFYFADSIGELEPKYVGDIVNIMKSSGLSQIGFHAHNNRGLAMANCLTAIDLGVKWVDSTITGMGRGPGNLQTELAIGELRDLESYVTCVPSLSSLINNYFLDLQRQCGWGANLFYSAGGRHEVHPTFIQEVLANPDYKADELLKLIEILGRRGARKYEGELDLGQSFYLKVEAESLKRRQTALKDKFQGIETIAIIGSGALEEEIRSMLATHEFDLVLVLNKMNVYGDFGSYAVIVHPVHFHLLEGKHGCDSKVLMPTSILNEDIDIKFNTLMTTDFPVKFSDKYNFCAESLELKQPKALPYSLSFAALISPKNIYLLGIGAYGPSDVRLHDEGELLAKFRSQNHHIGVKSLTYTNLDVPMDTM